MLLYSMCISIFLIDAENYIKINERRHPFFVINRYNDL